MYRKDDANQLRFEDFYLPFGGKLRSDNRWVILSKQIPWHQVEQEYSTNFSKNDTGNPAKSARIALGSLIIKERLGATDRETVLQIAENPYLQYFLGFSEYKDEDPFDHSLMTHFRKRFDKGTLSGISRHFLACVARTAITSTTATSLTGWFESPGPLRTIAIKTICSRQACSGSLTTYFEILAVSGRQAKSTSRF